MVVISKGGCSMIIDVPRYAPTIGISSMVFLGSYLAYLPPPATLHNNDGYGKHVGFSNVPVENRPRLPAFTLRIKNR
jgi:hypothetical protein